MFVGCGLWHFLLCNFEVIKSTIFQTRPKKWVWARLLSAPCGGCCSSSEPGGRDCCICPSHHSNVWRAGDGSLLHSLTGQPSVLFLLSLSVWIMAVSIDSDWVTKKVKEDITVQYVAICCRSLFEDCVHCVQWGQLLRRSGGPAVERASEGVAIVPAQPAQ